MKKHLIIVAYLALVILSSSSCLTVTEAQKKDYGLISSAVTFSSDKVIGEYGDRIPDDFDSIKFAQLVRNKIPKDYFQALQKYRIVVIPKGSYYLLEAFDGNKLILFDYSCTAEVDGPILLEQGKYDLNHLELYDKCGKVTKDNP
jgi:hypothetical protein